MLGRRKIFYYLLFLLGTFLLVGTVFKLGPSEVGRSFLRADFKFIGAGIVIYLGAVTFRSLRWYVLFRRLHQKIGYFRFLPTYFVSLMIGNLTPFKSGEVIVPYLFKKNLKSKVGKGFTLILFDRFFDILILVLCMAMSFALIGAKVDLPDVVRNLFWVAVLLFSLILALIILIFSLRNQSQQFFRRLAIRSRKRVFWRKTFEWFSRELVNFHQGIDLLKGSLIGYLIALLAVFSWACEFFAFYFFVRSVLNVPFWLILAFQVLSIGIGIISFIPAGTGVGTISFVFLISLTGYSVVDAGAGGITAKVISVLIIYLAGISGLIFTRSLSRKARPHAKA